VDPVLHGLVALGFGGLLIGAAWHKLRAPAAFNAALRGYDLLPDILLGPVGRLLPILEAAIGMLWLSTVAPEVASAATAMLLLLYAAAMQINVLRGRVHIDCGCALPGSRPGATLSGALVVRNLMLGLAALSALLPVSAREFGAVDVILLIVASITLFLLTLAIGQLFNNHADIRSWRGGA
jgi:hypothetical protein